MYIPKVNIELGTLLDNKLEHLEPFKDSYKVICMCAHGYRSYAASMFLRSKGYDTANLFGGILGLKGLLDLKIK